LETTIDEQELQLEKLRDELRKQKQNKSEENGLL
jgi:hypothetical protein